jgi:hypothetical protein
MIRSVEQQVRKAVANNVRLRARAELLERLSSTLSVFGMFTLVIGFAATTEIGLFVVSAIPLLTGGMTAVWARLIRRQLTRHDRRIEKTVSDFNEQLGYPESSFVWRKGPRAERSVSETEVD